MFISSSFNVLDHDNHVSWIASISDFNDLGSFQRIIIQYNGNQIEVLCGDCLNYRWIFFPLLEIGCMQSFIDDFFWNTEKLCSILNRNDAFTTVYGVYHVLSGGYLHA